jgi:undecaprenyl-diphosphatase
MRRSATAWLTVAGLALISALALLVVNRLTDGVDAAIINFVRQPALETPLAPLALITELGSTWAVTAVAGVLFVVLALRGNPRWAIASALTIGIASLLNSGFKRLIDRVRPDLLEPLVVEHGYAFPSGHSMIGATAWGIVAVVIWRSDLRPGLRRWLVGTCVLLIALIGLSRVYLGVHFPSDVLAGWTAGALIVLWYAAITRRLAEPAVAAGDLRAGPAAQDGGAAAGDPAGPRSGPPARR